MRLFGGTGQPALANRELARSGGDPLSVDSRGKPLGVKAA